MRFCGSHTVHPALPPLCGRTQRPHDRWPALQQRVRTGCVRCCGCVHPWRCLHVVADHKLHRSVRSIGVRKPWLRRLRGLHACACMRRQRVLLGACHAVHSRVRFLRTIVHRRQLHRPPMRHLRAVRTRARVPARRAVRRRGRSRVHQPVRRVLGQLARSGHGRGTRVRRMRGVQAAPGMPRPWRVCFQLQRGIRHLPLRPTRARTRASTRASDSTRRCCIAPRCARWAMPVDECA